MTLNDRFKFARETLKLSQRDVAEQIGVGATAISRIESGGNNPAERTIKLFCSKLGISEDWLRTGSGPMMAATLDDELSALAQAHGLDEMDVALIRTYINLPRSAQAALKDFLRRLAAAAPTPPSSAAPAITREEMDAIADRLDALEESALSSRDSPAP